MATSGQGGTTRRQQSGYDPYDPNTVEVKSKVSGYSGHQRLLCVDIAVAHSMSTQ